MSNQEIGALFLTMDADQNGELSDDEWQQFYLEFIEPFQTNGGTAGTIPKDAVAALFTADKKLDKLTSYATQVDKVLEFMDKSESITLFDYLFLRRVNNALTSCGEQGYLPPSKVYCALSITTPKTRHLSSPEEKEVYIAGIILTQGFYYGQTSFLSPLEFLASA